MLELDRFQEKEYKFSKQFDALIFKLYYLKYAHQNMINSVPEGFHSALDMTDKLEKSAEKVKQALEQAKTEFNELVYMTEMDHDDLTDCVPF